MYEVDNATALDSQIKDEKVRPEAKKALSELKSAAKSFGCTLAGPCRRWTDLREDEFEERALNSEFFCNACL